MHTRLKFEMKELDTVEKSSLDFSASVALTSSRCVDRRGTGAFGPKSPSAKQRQTLTAQGYRLRDTDDRISREKKDGGATTAGASDGCGQAGASVRRDTATAAASKRPQGGPVSYHGEQPSVNCILIGQFFAQKWRLSWCVHFCTD